MADHNLRAEAWVNLYLKDDREKDDADHCVVSSREHLLYLMYYSSELITVAKGIRFFLGLIALLLLVLLGVIGVPRIV